MQRSAASAKDRRHFRVAVRIIKIGEVTTDLKAFEIVARNEVNNTADSIGTVQRCRAVFQHFNSPDGNTRYC